MTTYPQITNYVYDNQNIIAEYDQTGKQTASYIHGPNIDEPLSAEIHNTRIYYHADGLGTITALTNHMGVTVQKYDYDSFGNIKFTPFPHRIKQPYTYTGREYDTETGLYYYRARYYDPKVGRFITRDPIKFRGGINFYAYVGNNPLKWRDPYGFFGPGGLGAQYPGHKDFYGGSWFDYYLEDEKLKTSPTPIFGDPERHFHDLSISEADVQAAIVTCNENDFQRAMHRGQDFFAHYDKGYRWEPFQMWNNLGLGHSFAGSTPDNDVYAWIQANAWTLKWLNEWINKCACKE